MYEIGRICVKLAGRDAGGESVIVDVLDDKFVMIDGNVRRKKCNIIHLEPTSKKIDIKKGASHSEVKTAFEKIGLPVWETKPRKVAERPRKIRKKKEKVVAEVKTKGKVAANVKKDAKKEEKTEKPVKDAKVVEEKKTEKKAEPKKVEVKKEINSTKKQVVKKKAVKKE